MSFAEIRRENGYPVLYIDGLRTSPLMYALHDYPMGVPRSEYNVSGSLPITFLE